MGTRLIYHKDDGGASPFDYCAVNLARGSNLRIACPYLSLKYIKRLVGLADDWKLITDLREWLTSTPARERKSTIAFIRKHEAKIRDNQGIHAKVLLNEKSAMLGSANFTYSGVKKRTELCVCFENNNFVAETKRWFEYLWENSCEIDTKELSSLIQQLPKTPSTQKPALTPSGSKRDVPLVELEEPPIIPSEPPPKIIHYQNARVHYLNGSSWVRVLQGSLAREKLSNAFFKSMKRVRRQKQLISDGTLALIENSGYYEFTRDCDFESPSLAACIIDGNSRNGRDRDVFGNP